MRVICTIKSVKLARSYQRRDGSYGNIHEVIIEAGDDVIIADTFLTKEGQATRGIVAGAIGTATIVFSTREWKDREEKVHLNQIVTLNDFALANRHILAESEEKAEKVETIHPTKESATAGENDGKKQKIAEEMIADAEAESEKSLEDGSGLPY